MKQHLSVFMLSARTAVYKVLALLVLMAAVQAALFTAALNAGSTDTAFGLEAVITRSRLELVLAVCFLLISFVLARANTEVSGAYTARRLSVSPQAVFLWQSLCGVLVYLLLWAVQVLVIVALCALFVRLAPPDQVTGQTVFLAFYRNSLLHCLMPMEDIRCWFANLLLLPALGLCSARRPEPSVRLVRFCDILFLLTVFVFKRQIGLMHDHLFVLSSSITCAAIALYGGLRKEDEANETAPETA